MGFAAGFNAGSAAVERGINIKRQKELDERKKVEDAQADELHDYAVDQAISEQEKRDRYRKGMKELDALTGSLFVAPEVDTPMGQGIVQNPSDVSAGLPMDAQGRSITKPVTPDPVFTLPSMDDAPAILKQAQMNAIKYPELADRFNAMKDGLKQSLIAQHADSFEGDLNTRSGQMAYMQHMADGNAMLGDHMTPEQLKEYKAEIKMMKEEGFYEALDALERGDVSLANNSWNDMGSMRGTISDVKAKPFNLNGRSVPGFDFILTTEDGNQVQMNTAELRLQGLSFEKQVEIADKGEDLKLRDRQAKTSERQAKTGEKNAETSATNAATQRMNTASQIADRAEDNAREDRELSLDSVSVVAGADDNYAVTKTINEQGVVETNASALNTGTKKTTTGKSKDKFGRTADDVSKLKDKVKAQIDDTQYGAGRTMMSELEKMNPTAYDAIMKIGWDAVDAGANRQDAASKANAAATKYFEWIDKGFTPEQAVKKIQNAKPMSEWMKELGADQIPE